MASSVAQALIARPIQTIPVSTAGAPLGVQLIDAAGNPAGYGPMPPGGAPVQTTKRARGDYPPSFNSLNEPWPGAIDQTVYRNGAVVDRYTTTDYPPSQFTQAYVDNMGAPGANQSTGPAIADTPATNAIAEILVRGGSPGSAFGGGWGANGFGRNQPLVWQPAGPSGTPPAGDPWAGIRLSGQTLTGTPPKAGLVTGPRGGTPIQNLHERLSRPPPQKGFNGKTTVTSNELRPTHSSIFSENAVLPPSMNTERWLTGY